MIVAISGRHCSSYGYVPNRIRRCFSMMKAQQAPPTDARHSWALAAV